MPNDTVYAEVAVNGFVFDLRFDDSQRREHFIEACETFAVADDPRFIRCFRRNGDRVLLRPVSVDYVRPLDS